MPSLKSAGDSLQQAWKALLDQWRTTAALWGDAAQSRFEKGYMDEYEPAVAATMRELGQLDQAIAEARRHVK